MKLKFVFIYKLGGCVEIAWHWLYDICLFSFIGRFSFCGPVDLLERGRSRENISSDPLLTLFLQVSWLQGGVILIGVKDNSCIQAIVCCIQALHSSICQSLGWNRSPDAGILCSVQEAPLSSLSVCHNMSFGLSTVCCWLLWVLY